MLTRNLLFCRVALIFILIASLAGCCTASAKPDQDSRSPSRTYLIVHGAWGGGWAFKQLDTMLRAAGHDVYRPTLTGLGERSHLANPNLTLDTHINDILNVIKFEKLQNIVLVGHSYGGMIISAVADRIPQNIETLIYIDAHLPIDGESMFDLINPQRKANLLKQAKSHGNGWQILPPWPKNGQNVAHPLATFENAIKLNNSRLEGINAKYILTLEPGTKTDAFSLSAKRARARGWQYYELRTGHNPHWTMPHELVKILTANDLSK